MENENNKLETLRAEEEKARLVWNAARQALAAKLEAANELIPEEEGKTNTYLDEAFEKAQDSEDAQRFYENGGLSDFEYAEVQALNKEIEESMRKNNVSPAPLPETESKDDSESEDDALTKDVEEEEAEKDINDFSEEEEDFSCDDEIDYDFDEECVLEDEEDLER